MGLRLTDDPQRAAVNIRSRVGEAVVLVGAGEASLRRAPPKREGSVEGHTVLGERQRQRVASVPDRSVLRSNRRAGGLPPSLYRKQALNLTATWVPRR